MGPPQVAIIENHAMVTAEVQEAAERDPERPGFARLRVRVVAADPLESWPNLFERDVGGFIDLYVPESRVQDFPPGARIQVVAKKTGLGMGFVQP